MMGGRQRQRQPGPFCCTIPSELEPKAKAHFAVTPREWFQILQEGGTGTRVQMGLHYTPESFPFIHFHPSYVLIVREDCLFAGNDVDSSHRIWKEPVVRSRLWARRERRRKAVATSYSTGHSQGGGRLHWSGESAKGRRSCTAQNRKTRQREGERGVVRTRPRARGGRVRSGELAVR